MHRVKKNYGNIKIYTPPEPINHENEFVQFCLEHLDYIRMIELPNLIDNVSNLMDEPSTQITNNIKKTICKLEKKGENTPVILKEIVNKYCENHPCELNKIQKQAILVYFESSPHIEFIIRNVITKLGSSWYHTILSGSDNYEYMQQIASSISDKISVLKFENCENMSQHNSCLKTIEYWQMLSGEKILHYTANTTLFKKNINDFMNYDYISASSFHQIGNGFSLRTRQTMIDILTDFKDENNETEDMFFSKIMNEHSIGILADKHTSSMFSTEYDKNTESMGGHNYWYNDAEWKNRLYENVVIQFKPMHSVGELEFRGGWKTVLYRLIECKFFSDTANNVFLDILEQHFNTIKDKLFENKWTGIVHLTHNGPPYLHTENIAYLFSNQYFLKSIDNCNMLFTLSPYVSDFLQNEFSKIQKQIEIITLKHPVVQENIIPFSFDKFKSNVDKRLIQIGQQYRKMTSIFKVAIPENYTKMWLTGTKNMKRLNSIMKMEQKYLDFEITKGMEYSVIKYYTSSYEEYDMFLSQNIVFIDLFDAAANNTVLECIVRKTPLIVNKLPGVVNYLGENYPLYFSNLEEIASLLNEDKLLEAHEYLKTLDTKQLEIDYFVKKLFTYIQNIY